MMKMKTFRSKASSETQKTTTSERRKERFFFFSEHQKKKKKNKKKKNEAWLVNLSFSLSARVCVNVRVCCVFVFFVFFAHAACSKP